MDPAKEGKKEKKHYRVEFFLFFPFCRDPWTQFFLFFFLLFLGKVRFFPFFPFFPLFWKGALYPAREKLEGNGFEKEEKKKKKEKKQAFLGKPRKKKGEIGSVDPAKEGKRKKNIIGLNFSFFSFLSGSLDPIFPFFFCFS